MVAIGLNEVDTLISYQEMKISFYSSWLGYIEIHGKSAKYIYVDVSPEILVQLKQLSLLAAPFLLSSKINLISDSIHQQVSL